MAKKPQKCKNVEGCSMLCELCEAYLSDQYETKKNSNHSIKP